VRIPALLTIQHDGLDHEGDSVTQKPVRSPFAKTAYNVSLMKKLHPLKKGCSF